MTTKTQNSTSTAAGATEESIQAFADRVRAALRDLPESDVVELTEGLEASLAEQAADSILGSALPHEGDAGAYASELREAAGLPASGGAGRRVGQRLSAYSVVQGWFDASQARTLRWIRARPLVSSVFDFVVVLQPLWWVARGLVAFGMVSLFLNGYYYYYNLPIGLVGCSVFVLISVQWGRGKWMPWRWLPILRSIGSVVLFAAVLIAAPNVLPQLVSFNSYYSGDDDYSMGYEQGLSDARQEYENNQGSGRPGMSVNGASVDNIFAYDANGKPLKDVQLFDQAGRPIVTVSAPEKTRYYNVEPTGQEAELTLVPRPIGSGMNAWNIFPLRRLPDGAMDYSTDPTGVFDITKAEATTPPKITVYPLVPLEKQAVQADGTESSKSPTS